MSAAGDDAYAVSITGTRIEQRIVVDAPVEAVWRLVADIAGWGRWSGLYTAVAGSLTVGQEVELTIALPGLKPQRTRATITVAEPCRRMEYASANLGGLVRARRYVDLRPLEPGRCAVANGECFAGLLGPLVARAMRSKVAQGFADMNQRLKQAVEAGEAQVEAGGAGGQGQDQP